MPVAGDWWATVESYSLWAQRGVSPRRVCGSWVAEGRPLRPGVVGLPWGPWHWDERVGRGPVRRRPTVGLRAPWLGGGMGSLVGRVPWVAGGRTLRVWCMTWFACQRVRGGGTPVESCVCYRSLGGGAGGARVTVHPGRDSYYEKRASHNCYYCYNYSYYYLSDYQLNYWWPSLSLPSPCGGPCVPIALWECCASLVLMVA